MVESQQSREGETAILGCRRVRKQGRSKSPLYRCHFIHYSCPCYLTLHAYRANMTRNCSPLVKTNHYDAKRKRKRSNRNSWSQLITASNQAKVRQGRARHLYAILALSAYSRQQARGTNTVLGETTESRMEIVAVKVMPVFDASVPDA